MNANERESEKRMGRKEAQDEHMRIDPRSRLSRFAPFVFAPFVVLCGPFSRRSVRPGNRRSFAFVCGALPFQTRQPGCSSVFAITLALTSFFAARISAAEPADKPFHSAEVIFPPEHWHHHGSCVVESPNGDILVCWYQGSGERRADDVVVQGARLRRGQSRW